MMKRVMVLFGSAGCAVAQSVLYAACAGAWSGETDLLLVVNGASDAAAERASLLFAQYEKLRTRMDTVPGERMGFTAPLQLRVWPGELPQKSIEGWASGADDALLCRALFSRATATQDLNEDLSGHDDAARALYAALMKEDVPLAEISGDTRLVLVGSLADGWGAAGVDAFTRWLELRKPQMATVLLMPYAGQDDHAHRRAEAALGWLAHGETVYLLGTGESDCASAEAGAANLVEWLAASCTDSFFRAEKPAVGLMTYRVASGKLGWESFPAAYRVCFGSLLKTAAAFRLTFEPAIRRGLTSPKWLRDKMIGWYAGYFHQAQKMTDEQRGAMLAELDAAAALLDGFARWMCQVLRNLPPLLRSSSAMEQARQEAADNYRQYIETAGQLAVMIREAEQSGLLEEKVVHRHDMEDNEAEKMQKIFQQMEARKQALAARQEELNLRMGGAAQLLMMKQTIQEIRQRDEEVHAQAAEAARRIDEAELIATAEDQHRITTARTKLQRMERYVAQLDACMLIARLEREKAKAAGVRHNPPRIAMDTTMPENGMFDPRALEKLESLPAQTDKNAKRLWAEAEAAWTGLVLPVKGSEANLAELAGSLKTKEEFASPVAALLRDMTLAVAKEVR
ncbi:MAG: hypothetical protein E7316_04935 [Clostridiales bacterium]|nr:hypothetical protein [Clostridiales bacterium]